MTKQVTGKMRPAKAGPTRYNEPAESDYVLSAGFVRLLLSNGLTLAHVGAWAAWHAFGQNVVEITRAALPHGMTTIAIRTKLARVRVVLRAHRPEACVSCREHTPRYCLACSVAKSREKPAV